jgi:hypothetical protein
MRWLGLILAGCVAALSLISCKGSELARQGNPGSPPGQVGTTEQNDSLPTNLRRADGDGSVDFVGPQVAVLQLAANLHFDVTNVGPVTATFTITVEAGTATGAGTVLVSAGNTNRLIVSIPGAKLAEGPVQVSTPLRSDASDVYPLDVAEGTLTVVDVTDPGTAQDLRSLRARLLAESDPDMDPWVREQTIDEIETVL